MATLAASLTSESGEKGLRRRWEMEKVFGLHPLRSIDIAIALIAIRKF